MNRNARIFSFLVVTLAALAAWSCGPSAQQSKKTAAPPDKIQGKAQVLLDENTGTDAAINAGGQSVYLWEGVRRYRLFFRTAVKVDPGKEYIAEGVYAQRVIDEIGDPDQGKNGYPLLASCDRVVKMAWSGLAFDATDTFVSVLRTRVSRYPARPLFLVTRLTPVASKDGGDASAETKKAEAEDKEVPEVAVPGDKQRALLVEGPSTLPAPLWAPAGDTVRCKVLIGADGKIAELQSGSQLCEAVPWSKFSYKPTLQDGRPVKVKTEVEVLYEQRK